MVYQSQRDCNFIYFVPLGEITTHQYQTFVYYFIDLEVL